MTDPVTTLRRQLKEEGQTAPTVGTQETLRKVSFRDSSTFKLYFSAKMCKSAYLQAGEAVSCSYTNKKAVGVLETGYYADTEGTIQPFSAFTSKKYTIYWTIQVIPEVVFDTTPIVGANHVQQAAASIMYDTQQTLDWYQTAGNQRHEVSRIYSNYNQNGGQDAFVNPFTGTFQNVLIPN